MASQFNCQPYSQSLFVGLKYNVKAAGEEDCVCQLPSKALSLFLWAHMEYFPGTQQGGS